MLGHLSEMLPPCDEILKRQVLLRWVCGGVVPERASSRIIELVFLVPSDLRSKAYGTFSCLDGGSFPHGAC